MTLELQHVKADAAAFKVSMEKELNKLRSRLGNVASELDTLEDSIDCMKITWCIEGMAGKLSRAKSAERVVTSNTFTRIGFNGVKHALNLNVKMKGTVLSVYLIANSMSDQGFPVNEYDYITLDGTDNSKAVKRSYGDNAITPGSGLGWAVFVEDVMPYIENDQITIRAEIGIPNHRAEIALHTP